MLERRRAQRLALSRLFSRRDAKRPPSQDGEGVRGVVAFRKGERDAREFARVSRALRVGSGHIVVTAADVERAETLVEAAIAAVEPYRVLWVSATTDGIVTFAGDVLAFAAVGGVSAASPANKIVSPIGGLIDEARGVGKPVVVVVADADLASVKRLESIRIQLDAAPGAIDVVRIVLVGCPVLSRILELPAARGLSSRVGMQVRLIEPRGRGRKR
jgi:hypothetical protein